MDAEDFEELYGEWAPRLYHAAMATKDRHFAVLVGGASLGRPLHDHSHARYGRANVFKVGCPQGVTRHPGRAVGRRKCRTLLSDRQFTG